jgi:hypothetical protein
MHSIIAAAAMAALSGYKTAGAAEEPLPLIVVIQSQPRFDTGSQLGLIGSAAASSVDRETAREAAALTSALPILDKKALVAKEFQCLAIEDPAGQCRRLYFAGDSPGEVLRALNEIPGQLALVATVTMRRSDTNFVASAEVRAIRLMDGKRREHRPYRAAYVARAPEELRGHRDHLNRYWREGEPSRLHAAAVASIAEIRQMLDLVMLEKAEGKSRWKELIDVTKMHSTGRYQCRGLMGNSCDGAKVLHEGPDRTWLVGRTLQGKEAAVSLDRNAALFNSTVNWAVHLPIDF